MLGHPLNIFIEINLWRDSQLLSVHQLYYYVEHKTLSAAWSIQIIIIIIKRSQEWYVSKISVRTEKCWFDTFITVIMIVSIIDHWSYAIGIFVISLLPSFRRIAYCSNTFLCFDSNTILFNGQQTRTITIIILNALFVQNSVVESIFHLIKCAVVTLLLLLQTKRDQKSV